MLNRRRVDGARRSARTPVRRGAGRRCGTLLQNGGVAAQGAVHVTGEGSTAVLEAESTEQRVNGEEDEVMPWAPIYNRVR